MNNPDVLMNHIQKQADNLRKFQFANSDQISLGEMIDKCKAIKKFNEKDDLDVMFDFVYQFPTDIDSWRGIYSELALNHKTYQYATEKRKECKPMQLQEFIDLLETAAGKVFDGYKGGEYTMSRETPVWVANNGDTGSTAVLDIIDDGWQVIIITGYRPN